LKPCGIKVKSCNMFTGYGQGETYDPKEAH
jgi:hypothetical protein